MSACQQAKARRRQMTSNNAQLGNAMGRPRYAAVKKRTVADAIAAARIAAAREAKAKTKKAKNK